MGGQYGSYGVTRAPQGAHPVADGNDRNVLETVLGQRAEAHLASLAERTRALLEENRADVLSVGHALELHKPSAARTSPPSSTARKGRW